MNLAIGSFVFLVSWRTFFFPSVNFWFAQKNLSVRKQASKGKPLVLSSFADHGRGCPGLAGLDNGVMRCLLTHLLSLFAQLRNNLFSNIEIGLFSFGFVLQKVRRTRP